MPQRRAGVCRQLAAWSQSHARGGETCQVSAGAADGRGGEGSGTGGRRYWILGIGGIVAEDGRKAGQTEDRRQWKEMMSKGG